AMHSGNAYLHGMKSVTKGSLAYIATQVQFSISSSSVFSCTDTVTDSKNFYHSILNLLEDPDEIQEVTNLMMWWTWSIMQFTFSSIELTYVTVGFFQILPAHSEVLTKTAHYPKFRKNRLLFENEILFVLIH
ncbi:hypothetical protein F4604DRAFT_1594912, partial [Suillus subluteus]